ncbi:MAG: DNA-binding protein [Tannerella sp.]|nr:DNA-binding protein [Tannerella sp.]
MLKLQAQTLDTLWESPPEESRPWVFWYWMQGAVSKDGITADLEAMKASGIGGAYLMPIKGVPEKPFVTPIVEQLSPLWWEMIDFTFHEADRLGMKLGFHVCDGFALAGGPWITPELSMQKVVWSQSYVKGGKKINLQLPQPEHYKDYYEDIAVYAYPALPGDNIPPEILQQEIKTEESGVIAQFAFNKPFTCRTIQIQPSGTNFQSQRLILEASNDNPQTAKSPSGDLGVLFPLESPRHGWQNNDFPMTHAIPPVTARYFRFLYDPEGTEPGSEDLETAKWKQSLKVKSIRLSEEARIHQYEGKNGSVWRVSPQTTPEQLPDELCIPKNKLIDITRFLDKNGNLQWKAPEGEWTILRMGHTSTGHTNATGGKGAGLECDKFNPEAIRLQFNSWFGKIYETAGKEVASRVLKIFHVDSWECGSQNWSPVFREEFKQRRGYDIYDYLPVMAGIPVENVRTSEKVLYDVRKTIAELLVDVFYKVLQEEAHAKGCEFSAESVAPTMVSDGMAHHKYTDIPMGEFWLQSPTHDKPNDVLDAVSGAHIYGKNIVQAEAFTQLRSTFTEYPEMLKTLQDRHYALGINRLVHHVYVLNPWLDKQPGMTLDGIGLYFQRDQTWWKSAKAWVDYAQRCQALLQFGHPVVDLAVFTGDEFPRRAILPDRLVPFIPGIFGKEKTVWEKQRLENTGMPVKQMPAGVTYSANIMQTEDWTNALRGYACDSFNPDALSQAKIIDGQIVLLSGMKYKALIVPGKHPMQPNPESMPEETKRQLEGLAKQGAKLIQLPYTDETFDREGIERDFIVTEKTGNYAETIAYTHRQDENIDIYFVSNQTEQIRELSVSLRVTGKIPECWNPVTGNIRPYSRWEMKNGRTLLPIRLDAGESVFIVLQKSTNQSSSEAGENWDTFEKILSINALSPFRGVEVSPWTVRFDVSSRGPEESVVFETLTEWNEHPDPRIRYYSGTAVYSTTFNWKETNENQFIELDSVYNLASVKINGIDCGTIWTKPYRLDISKALKPGVNAIEIEVSNTWANRIMGDEDFNAEADESKKIWTNARYRIPKKELVKSGLTGEIRIVSCLNHDFFKIKKMNKN